MKYTQLEIEIANKTSRSGGAIGTKAIVPQIIKELFSPNDKKSILDFGAGKKAMHTQDLKSLGYDVTAYEFGDNIDDALHDKNALERKYDVVYASNVLNVQSTLKMLWNTLGEIWDVLKDDGVFIANYPNSPRKLGLPVSELIEFLEEGFHVERIKHKNNIVFKLTKRLEDE